MTKVENLSVILRERIRGGEWKSKAPLPSRAQLAAEYGVSAATITGAIRALRQEGLVRVFQGKGAFVAELEQNGATALPNMLIGLTGSYIPSDEELSRLSMSQLFTKSIFDGIWKAANDEHWPVVLVPKLAMRPGLTQEYCRQIGVQGLIFLGGEGYPNALQLKQEGFPVILSNKPAEPTPLNYIDYDNFFVIREMASRFATAGHRRIGVIFGEGSVQEYFHAMKLQFIDTLVGHQVIYDWNGYWRGVQRNASGSGDVFRDVPAVVSELLALPEPPTAIFCWEPGIVPHVMKVLEQHNLRVPEDISIIVSSYSHDAEAVFSGFVMPHCELGAKLVHHLGATVRNPHHCFQELLKPQFFERGTVRSL